MNNVILMASFSLLFSGIIAGDKISPVKPHEVSKREGESVKLKCVYETTYSTPALYWYRHHSDLQAPQFILWKGAKGNTFNYIPDNRYESKTTEKTTELTIKTLTLADTGLYYCALETQ
uniref:Ig-like domain-containing protein n=1 Tax=Sander lucioperca TaxID=283035 RepID=A0A8C9Z4E3_SANLU